MPMSEVNRRQFLRRSILGLAAVPAVTAWNESLFAQPLGLPIGLQLYTLRNELAKDLPGTLRKVAEVGYKEVEIFDFYGKNSAELRRLLRDNRLSAPSAHYQVGQIRTSWEQQIEYADAVGIKYMVNAIIWLPERKSLDEYKALAEVFNKAGEQCKKAGIQFAYHNHNFEFKAYDGVVAYDELLRLTDPALVQFEIDCFWVTRAGKDPVEYMTKYPGRFSLLHAKGLKAGYPATVEDDFQPGPFTEVGQDNIDWKRVFAAAPQGGVKHYFVEQDECERSPLESIKISYDYLKRLKV